MTVSLYEANPNTTSNSTGIGANSLDLDRAYFLTEADGVVDKAGAVGEIVGVNLTVKTFDADNETVALDEVTYYPESTHRIYEVATSAATLAVTDELKYFNLTAAGIVDIATASATTGQVRLINFIKNDLGAFEIANK